jgi:predicted cupin superfamily sugar epimerase
VSPGFEFEDFEMAARDALLEQYPAERELVLRFTRATEAPACP